MSYTLIERKELAEAASSVSFDGIPQIYTDLIVKMNLRYDGTPGNPQQPTSISFNGSGTNKTSRYLRGAGSDAISLNYTEFYDWIPTTTTTANTFSNGEIYIPNYTGSTNKSASIDSVIENNGTASWLHTGALLWSNTAPITSITIAGIAYNFVAGSSVSLYGINRQQAIGAPKAVGGAISFANGYWYHAFTGSGTFSTQQKLEADYIVVAGGGSGGSTEGGGGGAGGVLAEARTIPVGSYPIAVGAGAASNASGANSTFFGRTAIGGGRGGNSSTSAAVIGGSGGGAGADWNTALTGAAGTAGQGNAGGNSARRLVGGNGGGYGGGGGGAGAIGGNGVIAAGGVGGAGTQWNNGSFYGGGGGGGSSQSSGFGVVNASDGGIGGGGKGSGSITTAPATITTGTAGTANTGGGGGGGGGDGVSGGAGYAGGSGIVIIRYKA